MESIEQMYYENPAFWDGSLFTQEDHLRLSFVANHLPDATSSLCDVGCGNGLFLNFLSSLNQELTLHGVDRSKAALAHVTAPKSLASITSLPFSDASFDTATCLEVIEHLPEQQYRLALSELTRIAARYVVISVPLNQDLSLGQVMCPACKTTFNPDYHFRSFTSTDMSALLEPYGFRMTMCKPYGPSQEFAFSRLIIKLKADLSNRFTVDILCPACGHSIAGCASPEARSEKINPTSVFKKYVKSVWPKITVDRWILAIYEREESVPRSLVS